MILNIIRNRASETVHRKLEESQMKSPNKRTRRDLISRRKQVSHIDLIKINGQQVAQAPMFPIHRTRSTGNYFISS